MAYERFFLTSPNISIKKSIKILKSILIINLFFKNVEETKWNYRSTHQLGSSKEDFRQTFFELPSSSARGVPELRNKKCLNPNLTCGTRIWGRSGRGMIT